MTKKKKGLYITLSVVVILVVCVGIGFLVIHFINANNPNHTYIQQFNHKRYRFETSDNTTIAKTLNALDNDNKPENFYIMDMGFMRMVSASKSKVISFDNQKKTSTGFTQNKEYIHLENKMILTCENNTKFTALTIQYVSKENKMKIDFTNMTDNTTATAWFVILST